MLFRSVSQSRYEDYRFFVAVLERSFESGLRIDGSPNPSPCLSNLAIDAPAPDRSFLNPGSTNPLNWLSPDRDSCVSDLPSRGETIWETRPGDRGKATQ